jgi:hypothetical protein
VWQQLDELLDYSPKVAHARLRRLHNRERQLARVERWLKRLGGNDMVNKVLIHHSSDEGSESDTEAL